MDAKLQELCRQAHEDRIRVGMLDTDTKNRTLELAADALMAHEQEILEANAIDMERGRERNMPQGLLDRLKLDHDRLLGMADGLRQVAKLEDPIGEVMSMRKRPNGLIIGKVRVAIGVVGIIFEARPNVTSDAFGLCFKSGNCAILKGGSDAIHSNIAIVSAMQEALRRMNIPKGALSLIESTDRETTNAFMKMKDYVDLLIPRGGRGLIQSVVNNATIPVIETGTGNCHVYVDQFADQEMAVNIIKNAKTQRIGVCNACESIVVHRAIAKEFLPCLPVYQPVHQIKSGHYSKQYIHSNDVYMQFPSITHRGTTQKQKSGYRRRITKPGTKLQNVLFVNPHIGTCPKEHDS